MNPTPHPKNSKCECLKDFNCLCSKEYGCHHCRPVSEKEECKCLKDFNCLCSKEYGCQHCRLSTPPKEDDGEKEVAKFSLYLNDFHMKYTEDHPVEKDEMYFGMMKIKKQLKSSKFPSYPENCIIDLYAIPFAFCKYIQKNPFTNYFPKRPKYNFQANSEIPKIANSSEKPNSSNLSIEENEIKKPEKITPSKQQSDSVPSSNLSIEEADQTHLQTPLQMQERLKEAESWKKQLRKMQMMNPEKPGKIIRLVEKLLEKQSLLSYERGREDQRKVDMGIIHETMSDWGTSHEQKAKIIQKILNNHTND